MPPDNEKMHFSELMDTYIVQVHAQQLVYPYEKNQSWAYLQHNGMVLEPLAPPDSYLDDFVLMDPLFTIAGPSTTDSQVGLNAWSSAGSVTTDCEIQKEVSDEGSPGKKDDKATVPKKGPRRLGRYKNASSAVLKRRRDQCREAQRKYRERKDGRIAQLELELESLQQQHSALLLAYDKCRAECETLKILAY